MIRICLVLLFTLVVSFLFVLPLSAEEKKEESVIEIASRLQERYDNLSSLSFNFSQRTQGSLSGKPKSASGQAFFLKEGEVRKMRWNYLVPDTQVLISDGTTFRMYFSQQQQMIVTPASSLEQDITYSFFSGRGNILQDFKIVDPDEHYLPQPGQQATVRAIKMLPVTPESQLKSIHLWVSEESLIQRIEMEDQFGTKTVINLSNLQIDTLKTNDPKAMKELFSFTPPEGTEVLHQ
jgi:outer membrane lipoprotein carrier protein